MAPKIKELNMYITSISNRSTRLMLMNNKEITENMLRDNKHMNKQAFYIFLASIRFTMCGILPKFGYGNLKNRRYAKLQNDRFR